MVLGAMAGFLLILLVAAALQETVLAKHPVLGRRLDLAVNWVIASALLAIWLRRLYRLVAAYLRPRSHSPAHWLFRRRRCLSEFLGVSGVLLFLVVVAALAARARGPVGGLDTMDLVRPSTWSALVAYTLLLCGHAIARRWTERCPSCRCYLAETACPRCGTDYAD